MSKRLPASMRTRQSLSDVIEGRLWSPAGREELVKLATRLIIEETLGARLQPHELDLFDLAGSEAEAAAGLLGFGRGYPRP
jgi:hypothetical protein